MKKVLGPLSMEELGRLQPDVTVDAVGLFCPLPIVKTGEAIRTMKRGQVLYLLADDPGVVLDLAAWCKSTRQELLGIWLDDEQVYHCYIRKRDEEPLEKGAGIKDAIAK